MALRRTVVHPGRTSIALSALRQAAGDQGLPPAALAHRLRRYHPAQSPLASLPLRAIPGGHVLPAERTPENAHVAGTGVPGSQVGGASLRASDARDRIVGHTNPFGSLEFDRPWRVPTPCATAWSARACRPASSRLKAAARRSCRAEETITPGRGRARSCSGSVVSANDLAARPTGPPASMPGSWFTRSSTWETPHSARCGPRHPPECSSQFERIAIGDSVFAQRLVPHHHFKGGCAPIHARRHFHNHSSWELTWTSGEKCEGSC